jgi:hypothetical protein
MRDGTDGVRPRDKRRLALGSAHDHENLWIADASVLPTSAAVNPSLTIAAQALRTAHLLSRVETACGSCGVTGAALITGGQQGIGLGIALALHAAGWRIALMSERGRGRNGAGGAVADARRGSRDA